MLAGGAYLDRVDAGGGLRDLPTDGPELDHRAFGLAGHPTDDGALPRHLLQIRRALEHRRAIVRDLAGATTRRADLREWRSSLRRMRRVAGLRRADVA